MKKKKCGKRKTVILDAELTDTTSIYYFPDDKSHRGGLVVRGRGLEVVGSIPGRDRPKFLKLVVVDFPLGA